MPHAGLNPETRRVLQTLIDRGALTTKVAAEVAKCSLKTIERHRREWRANGNQLAPEKLGYTLGRPRKLPQDAVLTIKALVEDDPLITFDEIADDMVDIGFEPMNDAMISRTLKRLGITRRKSSAFAHAQSDANRAAYREKLAPYDPRQLVFLDESSFDYAVCNRYKAWGHRGDRTWVRTIFQRGKRYSLLAASCLDIPMFACILESENMKKEDFYRWCEEVLIPNCRPFPERRSVIVMDNCSIHKPAATQALFEREGE